MGLAKEAAPDPLYPIITDRWHEEQPKAVMQVAREVLARFGDAGQGVLYYGSCLRTGVIEDRVLDFYVLVSSYRDAYASRAMAFWNNTLPPNVYYSEAEVDGLTVRAKYAVLSLADFERRCTDGVTNISVWARFCQPSVLLAANEDVTSRTAAALGNAVRTMLENAAPLAGPGAGSERLWSTAFDLTYGAELRSEGAGKGAELYALDAPYYDALLAAMPPGEPASADRVRKTRRRWIARRINGKVVSFLRLIKASFTFDGGIDYIVWKIKRHSGVEVEVTPFMRKHPVIAGIILFPKLRKKGGFR